MAFYYDKREHYGGALVLFRRNLAVAVPNAKTHRRANWYIRLKIGGRKGYVTRSTKLTIYEDAYGHLYKFENAKGDRNENNHLRCGDQLFIPLIEVPISVFKLSAALYVLRFLLSSQSFLDTALSRHQVRSASVVLTSENDVRGGA